MSDLPAPLNTADCDLRGLEWMAFNGDRILGSEAWLMASPEGRSAIIMLMWAAWKQCPAGSLPGNDRSLAQLAGFGLAVDSWLAVKAEAVHGWIECSDGRFYHPEMCQLARRAMGSRGQSQGTDSTKATRQKKWRAARRQTEVRLLANGIPVPQGATLETMRRLLKNAGDADVDATASPIDASRDGRETRKKEEEKRTESIGQSHNNGMGDAATTELWEIGLEILARLTGKPEGACSNILGKLAKNGKPSRAELLALLRRAETEKPDDPIAWLMAATKGTVRNTESTGRLTIEAWLDQQPDVERAPDAKTRELVATINGRGVLYHANRIAEAAGLPDDWSGNWDALGRWLREDLELDAATLAAVGRKARWVRDQGQSIKSIALFDREIRRA